MSHDHELLEELRRARKGLAAARIAEQDARLIVSYKKAARMKAEELIEEIMAEVETGKSGRPIIDHLNGRSSKGSERPEDEEDTADEHQRGPTVREPRIVDHKPAPAAEAPRKRGRPHKLAAAERPELRTKGVSADPDAWNNPDDLSRPEIDLAPKIGSAKDIDAPRRPPDVYTAYSSDRLVVPILDSHSKLESELILALHGLDGAKSRWIKLIRNGATNPELSQQIGLAFGAYGGSHGHDRCGNIHKGGSKPQIWLGHEGSTITLKGLALTETVRRLLSIPLPGDVVIDTMAAADRRTEEDLSTWAAKHGLDPVTVAAAERLDQVDVAEVLPAGPGEWTSADLERELKHAATCRLTIGATDPWPGLKRTGCDDARILEVLRSIWPGSYLVIQGTGPWSRKNGCTVHGGPTPAFWLGSRKSTDWKIAPPQLSGLQLADRIRSVLGIPRAKPADAPEDSTAKDAGHYLPMTQGDALLNALRQTSIDLQICRQIGLSDEGIRKHLADWPTHCIKRPPGRIGGLSWGITGGDDPRFFCGLDAERNWPTGAATLAGPALIKAIRKAAAIPMPKASAADRQPVRGRGRRKEPALS